MFFNKLVFMITDKCPAACHMCCFSCTPNGKNVLSSSLMHHIMNEAKDDGGYTYVGFTGGEAVLYFDLLIENISYAHSLGFPVILVSNGFWFADYNEGLKKLYLLHKAGLTTLTLSTDRFHQEYIPIECVRNAIRALNELHMPVNISLGSLGKHEDTAKTLNALGTDIYGAQFRFYPFLPTGNALKNISEVEYEKLLSSDNQKCASEHALFVYCDGTIYPCGSPAIAEIGFNLGNAYSTNLITANDYFLSKDSFYLLFTYGFNVFRPIYENITGRTYPECISSPCELCKLIFSDNTFLDFASEEIASTAKILREQEQR